jgi:thiamine pyrophosphate-dependent acetolactate synthase large subunit-like protein
VKLYQVLARMLAGTTGPMFGLMGDANMRIVCAARDFGMSYVGTVHETGAVTMADAYHRVSGRPGMATVTHGPALTNALTGLTEAARARSEVLLVSGRTPLEPTHPQRIDVHQIAVTSGAVYDQVYRPETLARDLSRALRRMRHERLPVLLDVPAALLLADCPGDQQIQMPSPAVAPRKPRPDDVDGGLGVLLSSSRVIIVAGYGAVLSGAEAALAALADATGALLGTTVAAKEMFRGHSRSIGIVGSLSHELGARALAEADCIVAFGAALNSWTSMEGELFHKKRVIHVDVDAAKIGDYTPVDEAITGDARMVAAAILELIQEAAAERTTTWAASYERLLGDYEPLDEAEYPAGLDGADIRRIAAGLDRLLPDNAALVTDNGRFVVGTWPYLHACGPREFINMNYFGSIGLGLPGAIGTCVARTGLPTVLATGDGGFVITLGELTTAVREKLPLIVTVWNDDAYGFEYFRLERYGYDAGYSSNHFPDLAKLAAGMGIPATTVRSLDDLAAVGDIMREPLTGPVLVDIKLDPRHNLVHW